MGAPTMTSQTICDNYGHTLFKVEYVTASGEVIKKTLLPEDYARLVGGMVKEDRSYWHIRQDFLPEGFYDGAISDEENYIIAFKAEPKKRLFLYSSGRYEIPYPELIFVIRMNRGHVSDKLVFALKKGSDKLYRYPFGNVSASGNICTGNIDLADVKKNGPAMFAELFFLGKTNDDYVRGQAPVAGKLTQQQLLEKLDGKNSFPSRLLIPVGAGYKTLKDISKMIQKVA